MAVSGTTSFPSKEERMISILLGCICSFLGVFLSHLLQTVLSSRRLFFLFSISLSICLLIYLYRDRRRSISCCVRLTVCSSERKSAFFSVFSALSSPRMEAARDSERMYAHRFYLGSRCFSSSYRDEFR